MARVDITATNWLVIGILAASFIIVLKIVLRMVPTPAIIRENVALI